VLRPVQLHGRRGREVQPGALDHIPPREGARAQRPRKDGARRAVHPTPAEPRGAGGRGGIPGDGRQESEGKVVFFGRIFETTRNLEVFGRSD